MHNGIVKSLSINSSDVEDNCIIPSETVSLKETLEIRAVLIARYQHQLYRSLDLLLQLQFILSDFLRLQRNSWKYSIKIFQLELVEFDVMSLCFRLSHRSAAAVISLYLSPVIKACD